MIDENWLLHWVSPWKVIDVPQENSGLRHNKNTDPQFRTYKETKSLLSIPNLTRQFPISKMDI